MAAPEGSDYQIPFDAEYQRALSHGQDSGGLILLPTPDPDTVRVVGVESTSDPQGDPDITIRAGDSLESAPSEGGVYDVIYEDYSGGERAELVGSDRAEGPDDVAIVNQEIEADPGDEVGVQRVGRRLRHAIAEITPEDLEPGDPALELAPADYAVDGLPEAFGQTSSTAPPSATETLVQSVLSLPGVDRPEGDVSPDVETEMPQDQRAERRRELRDDVDEALESAGYDPERWNTDARADGTLILQDPESNKTKTIEPDSGESGIDSAVESLGSSSDSSTSNDTYNPDQSASSDNTNSPGPSVDDLGGGRLAAIAAIGAAILYEAIQS